MQKYVFSKDTGRHDPYQTLKPRKAVQHAEVQFGLSAQHRSRIQGMTHTRTCFCLVFRFRSAV